MRKVCTTENPYDPYKLTKDGNLMYSPYENWQHPDSIEINSTEHYVYYQCNICGLQFKVPEPES